MPPPVPAGNTPPTRTAADPQRKTGRPDAARVRQYPVAAHAREFGRFETPASAATALSLEWLAFVTNTLSAWWVGGTAAEVVLVALWHFSLWSLPLVWLDSSRERSRWRNALPVWASLALIFAQPYTTVCRRAAWIGAVHGAAGIMSTVRVSQAWRDPGTYAAHGPWQRFYHVCAFGWHDMRFATHVKSPAERKEILWDAVRQLALYGVGVMGVGTFTLVFVLDDTTKYESAAPEIYPQWRGPVTAARWAAGAAVVFSFFMVMDATATAMHMVVTQFRMEPLCVDPLAAKTLADFWGMRWNRPIQRLLLSGVYRPAVATFGSAALGKFLVFAVSGVCHAYFLVTAGAPWHEVAWMLGFFLAQMPLLGIEAALGLRGSAWCFGSQIAVVPLFVEPVLRFVARSG